MFAVRCYLRSDAYPKRLAATDFHVSSWPASSRLAGANRPAEAGFSPLMTPRSVDELQSALAGQRYVADRGLATSIYLALRLQRPLLLEGEAGVGKTEVAKALCAVLETDLIRLQCYEGLDIAHAVYEWNYPRQLLEIRLMEASGGLNREAATKEIFSREFLIRRPLLQALEHNGRAPVLLIDELDRADEEFEGYLLEMLADFQITIPEIGTIRAETPPAVILTSNRTRELHDALKRRCLFYWIDYPDYQKELAIILAKAPEAPRRLAEQVAAFVQELRRAELYKKTGISESLEWIAALVALNRQELDAATVDDTLGLVLKNQEDIEAIRGERARGILNRALASGVRTSG
jgi:MoxR-like ATPase